MSNPNTKPNPDCKACHGLNVDPGKRQYAACPYCWGGAQAQQQASNAIRTGRGIVWNRGRFKILDKYYTPSYDESDGQVKVTCTEHPELFGLAGAKMLAVEDLIKKIMKLQTEGEGE